MFRRQMSATTQHCQPAIGESMLEYLNGSISSPESKKRDDPLNENDAQIEHGVGPPSHSLLAAMARCAPEQRIEPTILLGPRLSARTSMLMDIAQSLASSEDYEKRCQGQCFQIGNACNCVAVAVLRPVTDVSEAEPFPLPLGRLTSNEGEIGTSDEITLEARLQALEHSISPPKPTWDTSALRRVRVHHIASFRGLMEYILNLHTLPHGQRPCRGVLIDDVDILARRTIDSNETRAVSQQNTTLDLMNLTQILALLADSVHSLKAAGAKSLSVIVSMEDGLPINVERLISTWFPSIMRLTPSNVHKWNTMELVLGDWSADGRTLSVDDSWILERVMGADDRFQSEKTKCRLELTRVQTAYDLGGIVWKTADSQT